MTHGGPNDAAVTLHDSEMPAERMLSNHAAGPFIKKKPFFRRKIRFTLGHGICHTHAFEIPDGLKNQRDIRILGAACAQRNGSGSGGRTLVGPHLPGIVSWIPASLVAAMRAWATSAGGTLVSALPLWAAATRLPDASPAQVHAVFIKEHHGCMMLMHSPAGKTRFFEMHAGPGGMIHPPIILRRWAVDAGISETEILALDFSAEKNAGDVFTGPWAEYWQLL